MLLVCGLCCFVANLFVWRPPITGIPVGGSILLGCLTISAALGVSLPGLAPFVWKDKTFSVGRRAYFIVLALAGCLWGPILFYWNLVGL